MGIPHSLFEEKLAKLKSTKGVNSDTNLTADDLKELVAEYKKVYVEAKGEQFPSGKMNHSINFILDVHAEPNSKHPFGIKLKEMMFDWLSLFADPNKQLYLSVLAVFNSWDSPRANKYRSINQIIGLKGTAVNIQCMVFGNMGDSSGTGVLFTRNPSTGEKKLYGEFLINAQVLLLPCLHFRGSVNPLKYLCCREKMSLQESELRRILIL